MALRTGHGSGKGSPRIEVMPADELPSAIGSNAVETHRGTHGHFGPNNPFGASKRVRPGKLGGVDTSDPRFRPFRNWARRYAGHRRAELAKAHGGEISAGVGAIVESAALALGDSRFVQMLASETGDVDLFKRAADLGALARQHELAAWELAAREATARAASGPNSIEALRASIRAGRKPTT